MDDRRHRNGDEHGLETPQLVGNGAETQTARTVGDGEDAHHERARRGIHTGLDLPTSDTVDSITQPVQATVPKNSSSVQKNGVFSI